MAISDMLHGDWSCYRELTSLEKQMFDEAMENYEEANCMPTAVSTLGHASTSYRFHCRMVLKDSESVENESIIEIYSPFGRLAHIIGTTQLK